VRHVQWPAQQVLGVELEAIKVKLDGAPRMRGDQTSEIFCQLRGREVINLIAKVLTHAPQNGTSIGADGLVLQVGAVGTCKRLGKSSWVMAAMGTLI